MADIYTELVSDYMVVRSGTQPSDFERDVRKQIDRGWQPWGSVALHDSGEMSQPMVKYADRR